MEETQSIVVLGGSGFIGKEICRWAVSRGIKVTSISRSGKPSGLKAAWAERVKWVTADVFNPAAWQAELAECQSIVHSIAILFEKPQSGLTYERIFVESTRLALQVAEEAGVRKFIYLSVQQKPPFVASSFTSAKRQAEAVLAGARLKTVIFRPTLVYGKERFPTVIWAFLAQLPSRFSGRDRGLKETSPLSTSQLARAVVQAATDQQLEGVLGVEDIAALATSSLLQLQHQTT